MSGLLALVLDLLFWSLETEDNKNKAEILALAAAVKKLLALTPSVGFQIHMKEKHVFIYPFGDDFLDTGIINYTLSGLEAYPEAAEEFENALKIRLEGDESRYRSLLDGLRFSLEKLLKLVLLSEKSGLDQSKRLLKPWFKDRGLNVQISNLYGKLIEPYEEYHNRAVKHDKQFSLDEVEFMIYLTGSFMRLILQLENKESDSKD